jgi:PIN domain
MKTNFVLIDLENVQPKNITLLNDGPFKIKVFLGSNQANIPIDMASALQRFGPDADYIQIRGNGSNALDFHIAYYIGRLATENPDAYFHVISKDAGFDPLIKYLKTQNVFCHRSTSIADIPLVKISNYKSIPEKVDAVIDNLSKRKAGKPRTLKTLRSSIKTLFLNQLSDDELDGLIGELKNRGAIKVADGKVQYEPQS